MNDKIAENKKSSIKISDKLSTKNAFGKNLKAKYSELQEAQLANNPRPTNSAKESVYLTDEMYEKALEYVYDYGMPFEDAVEAEK